MRVIGMEKKKNTTYTLHCRVDKDLLDQIDVECKLNGLSRAAWITEVVRQFLHELNVESDD